MLRFGRESITPAPLFALCVVLLRLTAIPFTFGCHACMRPS
jgi:hypothetical protein